MCSDTKQLPASSTSSFERLPTFANPISYKLFLKPNLKTFKFHGKVTIAIDILRCTDFLKLHSNELDIHFISSTFNNGTRFENLQFIYDKTFEMIKIFFPSQVTPQKIDLHLTFTGIHNNKMKGFYRSVYKTPTSNENYMVSTQFESTYARMVFPCFDEPVYKAIFYITLQVDTPLTALSNMDAASIKYMDDGTKIVEFVPTIKMSAHLVAFAVGDLEYIENRSKKGTIVRVYTLPGKKKHGISALEVGIRALDYFNEWFDFDYPISKIDMVTVPDFTWGAMENTGLLMFRETALLVDISKTSAKQKSYISTIIAHEIAHQWFGNLVTPLWWDQLWLKEGFASFMQYLMVCFSYPKLKIWEKFLNDEMVAAFSFDSFKSSHPVEVSIVNPHELEEIYDDITYKKSNSILRMLYVYLGEEIFQKALRNYIKKHQYSNTNTIDLWNSLSEASGDDIQEMMDTWTKQVGFPIVSVNQTIKGNSRILTLSQKRFIIHGDGSESPQLWHIPIRVSTTSSNGQSKFNFLMTKETQTFTIEGVTPSEWIKLNSETTGFYRVKYNEDMLNSLIIAFHDKTLPVLDRFGIASDMFALVKIGELDGQHYLKLFEASIQEEEYVVRNIIDQDIETLSHVLSRYENSDIIKYFNSFVIENMIPLANKLGWESQDDEDVRIPQLRALVLSRLARSGHQPTIEIAKEKFYNYYIDKKDIDPNLRNLIYSVIGKEDGIEGIKKLQEIFETVNFSEVERSCIIGMAQTKDIKLLEYVFDYGIKKGKIRSQDLVHLFTGASSNKIGQDFAYKYFLENIELLFERFGGPNSSIFQKCLKFSAQHIASDKIANDFENFFKYNIDAGSQNTLDRTIKQTIEAMNGNYQLLKNCGDSFYRYLISKNLNL
uniref:Aminopeptidase n=1 Tax=Strongyloides papillosus TaxID=174720 RepID=A0A0N5BM54_STREA